MREREKCVEVVNWWQQGGSSIDWLVKRSYWLATPIKICTQKMVNQHIYKYVLVVAFVRLIAFVGLFVPFIYLFVKI